MGYWYHNCVRATYNYGKCSTMEGGRYAPMGRFLLLQVTTSQLTKFGPWKRIGYMLKPWGRSWMTSPTPPCAAPTAAVISSKHTTL